ncbi:6-phosphogluconolactonase [Sphingobacterium sp. Mn56C]|uniref:6-phosphogluconolactonase n=1 Tax=Sphingobacterium sp. Mn56C TaxID=3395261 RepID=UPI003BEA0EB4
MIQVYKDKHEISEAVASLFLQQAQQAIAANNKFTVALTGGSSPVDLYRLLATPAYADKIDWTKVYVFWGDERWVPLEDDLSNARMSFETLLNHVPIPQENIFPMYSPDASAEVYAQTYSDILKRVLGPDGVFDLILLGMGDDGHTASLFPGTAVLNETEKWVDAYYLEPQNMYRITLTAPLINKAKQLVVITFGDKKAPALFEVLQGERNAQQYPSQLLNPVHGDLLFVVDEAAASKLA